MRREFSAGGVLVRRLRGRWHMAAIRREVAEETGVAGRLECKLGDVRYTYTWEGERVFKVVSFFLVRYSSGRLGDLAPEHVHEVAEARWLPVDDAPRRLAYRGEREMAEKARARLAGEAL